MVGGGQEREEEGKLVEGGEKERLGGRVKSF